MKLFTNLIARIMFVIPLLAFASGHFMNAEGMAEMLIPELPASVLLVYVTGVALVAAAIAILFKKQASTIVC